MILKRVGVLSCGKVFGILYAFMGLIAGFFLAVFSLFGVAAGAAASETEAALLSLFFGVGAVFFLPVFYGVIGFIFGLLTSLIYNLIARTAGGLQLDLE